MKRQIKFRGKSVHSGEWLFGSLALFNEQALIIPIPDFPQEEDEDQNVLPETVGQFTGLVDKSGKDIYEGDIVQNVNDQSEAFLENSGVYWHSTVSGFTVIFETIGQWKLLSAYEHLEVIGNIHNSEK